MSNPKLNRLSEYFKQHTLMERRGSKAPFLKESKYLPLEVVPSGNIIMGGKTYPSSINLALSFILDIT